MIASASLVLSEPLVAVSVEIVNKIRRKKISVRRIKKTAQRILQFLDRDRAELSLALVDNRGMQKLNAQYRNKNEPTDVLSFPVEGSLPAGTEWLGDVVISVEKAEAQARKRRKTLEQEMRELLIHGILHLLGYDHERSARDARIMRAMEKRASRALERFVRSRS